MFVDEHEKVDGAEEQAAAMAVPAAITDTGCERDLNEDRYAVIETSTGVAWLVCDGMGGTTGGELAAQLVIDAVKRSLDSQMPASPEIMIRNALVEANRVIVLRRQNPAFSTMGTTAVGAMFEGNEVAIMNVGDSRAYLIRDGEIQQLTTDHTYVQQLVDRGEITHEEAMSHPQAHILTRCVGAEPVIDIDISKYWIWPVAPGVVSDRLVLCSDGLYSLISDREISQIVSAYTPQVACVRLVELAKARGGYDNITITIVPIEGQLRQSQPPTRQRSARQLVAQRPTDGRPRLSLARHAAVVAISCVLTTVLTALYFMLTRFM